MSLHIGIDALPLQIAGNQTGVYQYTLRLIEQLQQLDQQDRISLLFFSCRQAATRQLIESYAWQASIEKRLYRTPYRVLHGLGQWLPNGCCPLGKIDVYHGPAFRLLPRSYYKHSVATIHDINFVKHPELFPDPRGLRDYQRATQFAVNNADRLITVSAFTRDEVCDAYAIDPSRIRVIYPGIGSEYRADYASGEIEQALARYAIRRPYLLFVGLQEPKKNLPRLIEAFALARSSLPQAPQLVLAGAQGPDTPEILARIERFALQHDVLLTGHVAKADLPLLYAGAQAFVFPSLYEGFGIPVAEAMACGTPVISSNCASLPEVAGDAGVLIDPTDTEALADALIQVLSNDQYRQQLRERGLRQSQRFSWQTMAQQHLDLYRELSR